MFVLFLLMIVISRFPDKINPDLFMTEPTRGNIIKDLDLNLQPGEVAFSFLELSSGESTLIQESSGKNVLINTGSKKAKKQFRQQLEVFQVKKIDALIFTNIGKQYTGNLSWILEHVEVKEILIAEEIKKQFLEQFDVKEENIQSLKENDRLTILNGVTFEVAYIEKREDFNEGGLVLVTEYGNHRFLYMGVASKDADEALIERGTENIELIKVGGFGHYFGTSERLLNHADPQVAVIFKKDSYTISDEVLRRLQEHWAEILLPHDQGIIMMKCNKKDYEITTVPLMTPDLALRS